MMPQVDGAGDEEPKPGGSKKGTRSASSRGRGRTAQSPAPAATEGAGSQGSERYSALSVQQSQSQRRAGAPAAGDSPYLLKLYCCYIATLLKFYCCYLLLLANLLSPVGWERGGGSIRVYVVMLASPLQRRNIERSKLIWLHPIVHLITCKVCL